MTSFLEFETHFFGFLAINFWRKSPRGAHFVLTLSLIDLPGYRKMPFDKIRILRKSFFHQGSTDDFCCSFASTSAFHIPSDMIWSPSSVFDGIKPFTAMPQNPKSFIYGDGKVIITQRILFTGICLVTAEYFPYDWHQCFIGN